MLNLSEGKTTLKSLLKNQIDKASMDHLCVNMNDLEKTSGDMASDGVVQYD